LPVLEEATGILANKAHTQFFDDTPALVIPYGMTHCDFSSAKMRETKLD